MKIAAVEAIPAGNWLFFQITTDTGITGVGEAGLWAYSAVCREMVEYLRPYLVGKDALAIEQHWQYAYRGSHFRGAAINGALAAVDMALWDIAGKHYGAPVHRLLGGPTRTKIRLYTHLEGETPPELAESARRAVEEGFTAVRFNAFGPSTNDLHLDALVQGAVDQVAAVRETVGRDVDICVECHYRFTPSEAMEIGRALAPFRILFLEDPIPPEDPATMGALAHRLPVAIGTGERLQTLEEFRSLLTAGPVAYLRPDLCLTGITQAKKIAAVAEAWHVGVIPHNFLSPVSTAACVHLDAAIPNFVLQEYTGEEASPKRNLVREPIKREGGYLIVPETPGLGVELDLNFIRSMPPAPRRVFARTRQDGSVIDG